MELVVVGAVVMVAVCLCAGGAQAQLRVGFYDQSCPQAEVMVRDEVGKAVSVNSGLAAGLVRMHFHDCFVKGCDASVLLDSTASSTAEKDAIPNKSLRGFEVVDSAKQRLESACKGVVSCADILAFAARDSVVLAGGSPYLVPAGRRDGNSSAASDAMANLPPPTANVAQLTQIFGRNGLSQDEMVTLSGAHTLGVSHCSSFSSRLYDSNGSRSQDSALDAAMASRLAQECPPGSANVVAMDASPNTFDTSYFQNLLAGRGVLASDQTLTSDNATAALVAQNAYNIYLFATKFGQAMVKMGAIQVLTGSDGQIRTNCRVAN
ncbi:hypothetical protein GUJ93_ZPchr0006g46473 [Zizania palustris]|uniref:Peroxidase 1 n=1 Tax=Zizania palustris TaxID=103762 RepID=A0A8J5SX94_ZIZPA|nr:hypothetical protein GUJ93_ZPchr0006g46473 [Zizania palustris]